MAQVIIRGHRANIPGLGSRKDLFQLSEKRVTQAVRNHLKQHFGNNRVKVSCSAQNLGNLWRGNYKIKNGNTWRNYNYRVIP